ncbi:MerR family transcriptional regulator [Corynebacterium sp. P6129]|uniref:MerR family transcriptional regulator n=1 Tax=Corynebacterium antarcticum TaxID=2800405 RepID=UPI002260D67B|nr:MerR family transcriptional regulator [Corynebacterium antarcticum]MCX7492120.1 MerR family transcriptional regulator [Corynebacterium antarcticum]
MNNIHGLKIGVFSQLTGISVRMLRHYGTHGVLTPAATDPATGYRFYSSDQIPEALLVTRLRDAGFPVRDIRTILDSRKDTGVLTALSRERRRAILRDIAAAETQLDALAALDVRAITDPVPVTRTVFPAMDVISLRAVLPDHNHEHHLWERLRDLTSDGTVPVTPEGVAGACYHDAEFRESQTDVEIFVRVTEPCVPEAPVTHRVIPARDVVTATLHGPYERMGTVTAQIGAHLVEHGLEAGPMMNIYGSHPRRTRIRGPGSPTWCSPSFRATACRRRRLPGRHAGRRHR